MYVASDPEIGLMWWEEGIDKMVANKSLNNTGTITWDSRDQN